jgi:hypothetical protein
VASQPVHKDRTEEGVLVRVDASILDWKKTRTIGQSVHQEDDHGAKENYFQFEIPRIISDILNSSVRAIWYLIVSHMTSIRSASCINLSSRHCSSDTRNCVNITLG